jgi:hypothetical protein
MSQSAELHPEIASLCTDRREAGRVAVETKEELRPVHGAPAQVPVLIERGQALAPDKLPRLRVGGELGDALRLLAKLIGPVEPGSCKEDVRRQGAAPVRL